MSRAILTGISLLVFIQAVSFGTPVSGLVSGIWDPTGNPYEVIGDTYVPDGQTLEIQPGVEVVFQGQYRFDILEGATLYAAGTVDDSIIFTAQDTSVHWLYLFFQLSNDSSTLEYCLIEYGGSVDISTGYGAVTIQSCDITVRNCELRYNHARWGGGIYCREGSGALIEGCDIHDNWVESSGGGIGCSFNVTATITGCDIWNNSAVNWGGGIYVYSDSNPLIEDCRIYNNTCACSLGNYGGGGIYFAQNTSGTVSDCFIYDNTVESGIGGGVSVHNATVHINRTVICFNSATEDGGGVGMTRSSNTDTTYITNCDIFANNASVAGGGIRDADTYSNQTVVLNSVVWLNFAPTNPQYAGDFRFYYCNISQTAPGVGNINAEPMFVFPDTMNFNLLAGSPCIDTGNPDPVYNDPDGTIGDIGVFYFHQDISVRISPDTLYFDSTMAGEVDSSEYWVVNLLNEEITVDSIVYTGDNFWTPDSSFIIGVGDSTMIPAAFIPFETGMLYGTAIAYSRGICDSIVFTGYGQGYFYINPDSLIFDDTILGHSETSAIWVVNPNLIEIVVDSAVVLEPAFSAGQTPFTVPAEDSVEFEVTFTPYRNGAFLDSLNIYSIDMVCIVALVGEGYGFFTEPESLDFGTVNVGSEDTLMMQAINWGTFEIIIDSIDFSTEAFYAVSGNYIIPAEDTIDIEIVFAPMTAGVIIDTVIVHSSAGMDTMTLMGYGLGWSITPDTLDFGQLTVGEYDTLNMYVMNFEFEDLTVDSMVWMDAAYIIENTSFTVVIGGTTEVPVIFHPETTGGHNSMLTIYTDRGVDNISLLGWANAVGVNDIGAVPLTWEFPAPHPNPFNDHLTITFTLPKNEIVSLTILNSLGREIAVLEEGSLNPGVYQYTWHAENCASGLYFVKLQTSTGEWVRKAALVK